MKKLFIALICGLILAPVCGWGQQWVDPYYTTEGGYVPGHWKTPEDHRQDRYSTPGKVNPYTGQFNPYTGSGQGPQGRTSTSVNPNPLGLNPYYSPPEYRWPVPPPPPPPPPAANPFYPQPDYRFQGR
jgi:hypothetical protein